MLDPELESIIRRIRLVAFDFDGVFTDNMVLVSEDGAEFVRCWRGDGIGLRQLERFGIATAIISTETNPVVTARSRKLAVRCFQGCENKLSVLESLMAELNIPFDAVAFVGNDVNDLGCLAVVGLPIVVQDAHPDVLPAARLRTSVPGGYGAVREVCDLFVHVLTEP